MTTTNPSTTTAGSEAKWVRLTGAIEATTYLALLVTLLWRILANGPDLSATMGPVHGLAFGGYFVAVAQGAAGRSWQAKRTLRLLGAALIPGAGYFVDRHLQADP